MKRTLILILACVVLTVVALPAPRAHAQLGNALGSTFTFEEGTTILLPQGWTGYIRASGFSYAASQDTQILFALNPPDDFDFYGVAEGDLAGYLATSFGAITDTETLDPSAIESLTLGSYDAARSITTTSDQYGGIEHWVVITQLNNGIIFYISVINLVGDTITEGDAVLTVLNSFDETNSTYTPESLDLSRPTLDQTYTLTDGVSLSYPTDWQTESGEGYELAIFNDQTYIVVDPMGATAFTDFEVEDGDLATLFEAAFAPIDKSILFDPTLVQSYNLDHYAALRYDYTDMDNSGVSFQRIVLLTQLSNGEVFYLAITPQTEATIFQRQVALQILSSLSEPEETSSTSDDITDFYTFEDNSTLTWDSAIWTYSTDDNGNLYLDSSATSILFGKYFPTVYTDNGVEDGDNAGLMQALFYSNDNTIVYDPANYQDITLGTFTAGRYDFIDRTASGEEYQHTFFLLQFSDNSVALFSVIPLKDHDITEMDTVIATIANFTDAQ